MRRVQRNIFREQGSLFNRFGREGIDQQASEDYHLLEQGRGFWIEDRRSSITSR